MRRCSRLVVIAAGLTLAGWWVLPQTAAGSNASAAEPLSVAELSVRPKIRQVVLAPTGDRLAVLQREAFGSSVWLADPATGETHKVCDARPVEGLRWSIDGSLLFLEAGSRIGRVDSAGGRPAWIYELDAELEQEIVEVDPVRPRHLLLTEKQSEGHYRLLRLDESGALTVVLESASPITNYLLDAQGEPAVVKVIDGDDQVIE